MQIHEITRRSVSEAGILGQIGSRLAAATANKLLPGSVDNDSMTQPSDGDPRMAAMKATSSIIGPLSKNLQNGWAQQVQNTLASSKDRAGNAAISVASLDAATQTRLKQSLMKMINDTIGIDDYSRLPALFNADPIKKEAAIAIKLAIGREFNKIYTATMQGKTVPESWAVLTKDGIAPAMHMIGFDSQQTQPKFQMQKQQQQLLTQLLQPGRQSLATKALGAK